MIRKLCLLSLISCLLSALDSWSVARAQTTGASGVSQSQRESALAGAALQTQKDTSGLAQAAAEKQRQQRQPPDQKAVVSGRFSHDQILTMGQENTQALWSVGPKGANARFVSAE